MAVERMPASGLLPLVTSTDGRLPPDQELLPLAVALPACLLLLLLLLLLAVTVCCLRRSTRRQRQYQELQAAAPPVPAGSAPVIPVSPSCLATLVPHTQHKSLLLTAGSLSSHPEQLVSLCEKGTVKCRCFNVF